MKHTPGPWYGKNTSSGQGLIISEQTGENIAVSYKMENVDIIAAAPKMIEHISLMLRTVQDTLRHGITDGQRKALNVMCHEANDIIQEVTES